MYAVSVGSWFFWAPHCEAPRIQCIQFCIFVDISECNSVLIQIFQKVLKTLLSFCVLFASFYFSQFRLFNRYIYE